MVIFRWAGEAFAPVSAGAFKFHYGYIQIGFNDRIGT